MSRTHHDVHPRQLAPRLDTHPQHQPPEHARLAQRAQAAHALLTLDPQRLLDLAILRQHHRVLDVAIAVQPRQHAQRLVPSVLRRQPPRAVREEGHPDEQDPRGHHLHGPGDAERRCRLAGVVGAVGNAVCGGVLDEELYQDAPSNRPLLETTAHQPIMLPIITEPYLTTLPRISLGAISA